MIRSRPLRTLVAAALVSALVPSVAHAAPGWSTVGDTVGYRGTGAAAVTLSDGGALLVGNAGGAERYNPASGTWSNAGTMLVANRRWPAAVRLRDGRVLVTGGDVPTTFQTTAAEIFDPATGLWMAAAPMGTARDSHAAVLLADGRVLVAGGSQQGSPPTTAEIYNPATDAWTPTAPTKSSYRSPGVARLDDGRVLFTGGVGYDGSSETYDPITGKWSMREMTATRTQPTAVKLPDGHVLVQGGDKTGKSAELFDPQTNTWAATGATNIDHRGGRLAVLGDGRAILAGGTSNFEADDKVELFDAATGAWSYLEPMPAKRYNHHALVLGDGSVLVTAGLNSPNGPGLRSSVRYVGGPLLTPDPTPTATATPDPTVTATPTATPTPTPDATPTPTPVPPLPQRKPAASQPSLVKLPKTLKATRSGTLTVKVSCAGNATCKDTIVLKLGKATFARTRFTIAAGKTGTVTLELSTSERRKLRGKRATLVLAGRRVTVKVS